MHRTGTEWEARCGDQTAVDPRVSRRLADRFALVRDDADAEAEFGTQHEATAAAALIECFALAVGWRIEFRRARRRGRGRNADDEVLATRGQSVELRGFRRQVVAVDDELPGGIDEVERALEVVALRISGGALIGMLVQLYGLIDEDQPLACVKRRGGAWARSGRIVPCGHGEQRRRPVEGAGGREVVAAGGAARPIREDIGDVVDGRDVGLGERERDVLDRRGERRSVDATTHRAGERRKYTRCAPRGEVDREEVGTVSVA